MPCSPQVSARSRIPCPGWRWGRRSCSTGCAVGVRTALLLITRIARYYPICSRFECSARWWYLPIQKRMEKKKRNVLKDKYQKCSFVRKGRNSCLKKRFLFIGIVSVSSPTRSSKVRSLYGGVADPGATCDERDTKTLGRKIILLKNNQSYLQFPLSRLK